MKLTNQEKTELKFILKSATEVIVSLSVALVITYLIVKL
jgi:hypothetical protein